MEHLIGQTLNRYKILSLLGEGGMGAVFKAHDSTLQRDVAVKVMDPHFARLPNFQERFLQEARSAARLKHPNIVQVHDFGQDGSHLYIVMEFIPGDDLDKMLNDMRTQGKWIMLNEAVLLMRQVSLAIDYAHRQGVLHCNIKPSNIMVEPETAVAVPSTAELPYRPVVTDLGLAKLAEGGVSIQEGSGGKEHRLMGTPAYMSPEQALGKPCEVGSDVYSLGVLLFELCTGQLPFPAKTITCDEDYRQAIRYHVQMSPPRPRSIQPDLPDALEKIIQKSLEKEPANRFPSAMALADALKETLPAVAQVASAPTDMQAAVSLFTQYQQSLIQERGASILKRRPIPQEFEAAPAPADTGQDRIQILLHDKTSKSVLIKPKGMTVGRDPNSDIPLDDPKVSRQHAHIECVTVPYTAQEPDKNTYFIVDLNSTNGTFVGPKRLLPGVSETWTPDKVVRIGDNWLRLLSSKTGEVVTSATVVLPNGAPVDPSLLHLSAGQGRVGLYAENLQIGVEPGQSVVLPVITVNRGVDVDRFQMSVSGLPAGWLKFPSQPLRLMPGAQQELSLAIQPPRATQSRAGRYPATIRVASQTFPEEVAEVQASLTVSAFSLFSSEMQPARLQAGQAARITVNNQGNSPEVFTLSCKDPQNVLAFTPPQARLTVPEGQSAAFEFQTALRQPRWVGGEKAHPFSAQVSTSQGQTRTHEGQSTSRGRLPIWALPALLLVCLILGGGLGLLSGALLSGGTNRSTKTAIAAQTELALVVQQTEAANTLTADALSKANQATQNAATATAAWQAADDDRDGLPNGKELELKTLPDKRDTDEDGLEDGEEVNTRKTDPLKSDTDGDGLKDGEEIARGLDPLSPDTDKDGTPDAQDPSPLEMPTFTPTITPSPTLTPSLTPTKTETPEHHTISNVNFDLPWPSGVSFGQNVNVNFNYSTTGAGGVRIFARPVSSGAPTPNYAASGSSVYASGNGSGNTQFTITSGTATVDQVHLQMWNADQSRLLYETFVDVNYHFTNHPIYSLSLSPAPPAQLSFNQKVNLYFNYTTAEAGGIRIFPRPFANGAQAQNYAASGSPVYPAGSSSGDAYFTITSGGVKITQIRFQIWNADQSSLLDEWFITVSYRYQ